MLQVTLSYNSGAVSRTFDIFSASLEDSDLFSALHKRLNGGYVQEPVGWRYKGSVDFAPLNADFTASYWLQAFAFASGRAISFDYLSVSRSVTLPDNELQYQFFDGVSFLNGFTLKWIEPILRTTDDDGSTVRVLKPTYEAGVESLSGDTLTLSVDLFDPDTIEVVKQNLKFINYSQDDIAFGFLHHFNIRTAVVFDSANREWLKETCIWRRKQIDTSLIFPDNPKVYDVVCPDTEVVWAFENGVDMAKSTALNFLEQTPHTAAEEAVIVPPFILDESKLDEGRLS